jgi:hypothetical protein
MNKISKGSRKLLVAQMNKAIANNPLPELRENLINIYTVMLMDLNIYKGYIHLDWIRTGYDQWVKAGRPDSRTPFLGDQTLIKFF